jgi:hypothetical protein
LEAALCYFPFPAIHVSAQHRYSVTEIARQIV